MSKALEIMRKAQSVEKRAGKFAVTIARNLQKEMIDTLVDQKEKLEDEIESVLDFSLVTDLNHGLKTITREEAERRFKTAMEKGYQLKLLKVELKVKRKLFKKYFDDDASSPEVGEEGGK